MSLLNSDIFVFFRQTCLNTEHVVCHQVVLIYHRLALGLVGLVGRILLVWQLLLVTVEQLLLLVVDQL